VSVSATRFEPLEPVATNVSRLPEEADEDLIAFEPFRPSIGPRSAPPIRSSGSTRRSDLVGIYDQAGIRRADALLSEQTSGSSNAAICQSNQWSTSSVGSLE
jgi:hypothetical protein